MGFVGLSDSTTWSSNIIHRHFGRATSPADRRNDIAKVLGPQLPITEQTALRICKCSCPRAPRGSDWGGLSNFAPVDLQLILVRAAGGLVLLCMLKVKLAPKRNEAAGWFVALIYATDSLRYELMTVLVGGGGKLCTPT